MGRLVVIFAAALIVLNPQDFLRIARTLGAIIADLRRAFDDLTEIARDMEPPESEDPAPSRTG